MQTDPFPRRRRVAVPVLALLLVASALGLPAIAQDAHRSFTATVTQPGDAKVAAGSTTSVTVTLQNTSSGPHALGSAEIRMPSDFTLPDGGTTVALRDLSLPPGASKPVTFDLVAPCATGRVGVFEVQAKQANNFQGPPGNDLRLVGEAPAVTVDGSCGVLSFDTQPRDAEVGALITSRTGDPTATKVRVRLTGSSGLGIDGVAVTITLADAEGAVLTCVDGCTQATRGGGIATFEPKVSAIGRGFRLVASSDGILSVESGAFSIWEDVERCDAGQSCSVSQRRSRQLTATVSGVGPAGAGADDDNVLFLSLLPVTEVDCSGGDPAYPWNHAPATVLFDLDGSFTTHKVATLLIDRAEVRKVTNNGASFYQVCFLGEDPFTDRDGGAVPENADGTYGPALLTDCRSNPSGGACVTSRTKTSGGDMQVVIHLPPKDPMFR